MLRESLDDLDEIDDLAIGIASAIEKLEHSYDNISAMVGVSLILDQKLKMSSLKVIGWKEKWIKSVENHFNDAFDFYKSNSKQAGQIEANLNSENLFESGYDSLKIKYDRIDEDTVEHECARYFNAPKQPRQSHLLSFWKENNQNYPILSAMAKDYLTVQASSVSAERAFSSGRDLVSDDRCSLAGKTVEMTQFLKFNLP